MDRPVAIDKLNRDLRAAARTVSDEEARFLVSAYYIMQEDRKRSFAQKRELERQNKPNEVIDWFAEQNERMEEELRKALDIYTQYHEMGSWMRQIYGIGPVIAAGMLASIDMDKCPTAGHILSFAGWAGDNQKPWKKGAPKPFSGPFRTLCCHPETLITTSTGQKPIKFIVPGDEVLTHKGRFRKVKAVHKTQHMGALVALRTLANSAAPLLLTDNHPVYTEMRRSWRATKGRQRASFGAADRNLRKNCLPDEQIRVMREERRAGAKLTELAERYGCSQSAISQICNSKTRNSPMENERMWVRSDGILPGWRLSCPRLPHESDQILHITNFTQQSKQLPSNILLNQEIAWLLGIYMAEGHVTRNCVGFSLHKDEILYQEKIKKILHDVFSLEMPSSTNGNSWQGIVSSKALVHFFESYIGTDSMDKHVPMELLAAPAEVKAAFLRGWFDGDGNLAQAQLTTSSAQADAHALLNSLGIASTITPYQNSYKISVTDRAAFNAIVYASELVLEYSTKDFGIKVEQNALWAQARESQVVPYIGNVFNLEVEEDESYTANGIAVHNCWKAGQSFMKFHKNDACFYGKIYFERKQWEILQNESGRYAERAAEKLAKFNIGKETEAFKHYSSGKLPPAHIDARARRYAVKIFLSHLHQEWYQRKYGKPAPLPFPIAHLGHAHIIAPPTNNAQ